MPAQTCFSEGDIGGPVKIIIGFLDGVLGPEDCQTLCQNTESCGFFVWRSDGRCHYIEYHHEIYYNGAGAESHISGPAEC